MRFRQFSKICAIWKFLAILAILKNRRFFQFGRFLKFWHFFLKIYAIQRFLKFGNFCKFWIFFKISYFWKNREISCYLQPYWISFKICNLITVPSIWCLSIISVSMLAKASCFSGSIQAQLARFGRVFSFRTRALSFSFLFRFPTIKPSTNMFGGGVVRVFSTAVVGG